ncbi:DUF4012 domain-containing protein [Nocardioides sp.]|uniref:DUF4012 domain-containing protein n=1 Tax=Nocardioides sp. TaxID=35761 RepID=UPI0035118352
MSRSRSRSSSRRSGSRGRSRSRRPRLDRRWLLGGALLAVLAVAWAGYQALQVRGDLNRAADAAQAIRADASAGQIVAEGDPRLTTLTESAASADDRTHGFTWSLLTRLPFFGDDARGVRAASAAIDAIARDGISQLVTASAEVDKLTVRDGRIPLDRVTALQAPVASAAQAFERAQRQLAAEDPSGYVGPVRSAFDRLAKETDDAAAALRSAEIATRILPSMLGADGPRNYMLVFQNNAEVRSTGGLPGAGAYLRAANGKISLLRQTDGFDFPKTSQPVLKLTEAEQALYGTPVGEYYLSANMTPDVPRASDIMKALWLRSFPNDRIDGVLMVDTVSLGYLIKATGPITVQRRELNGDNLVDELLNNTYLREKDPLKQNVFFAEAARVAFEKITSDVKDPAALLRGVAQAAQEGRVFLHSYDRTIQGEIDGTRVAGQVEPVAGAPAKRRPDVLVTYNDNTGSKMSYYLRTQAVIDTAGCTGNRQSYTGRLRATSIAPKNAAQLPEYITGGGLFGTPPGLQLVSVRLFAPQGGTIGEVRSNGQPLEVDRVDDAGRPVAMTFLQLSPGQTINLSWTMESAKGQLGPTDVRVTPTIDGKVPPSQLAPAC